MIQTLLPMHSLWKVEDPMEAKEMKTVGGRRGGYAFIATLISTSGFDVH